MRLRGDEADARRKMIADSGGDLAKRTQYKGDVPVGTNDDYIHVWVQPPERLGCTNADAQLYLEFNGTESRTVAKEGEPFQKMTLIFDWESLDHLISTLQHYQRVIERMDAQAAKSTE